jgi:hypothetical protein
MRKLLTVAALALVLGRVWLDSQHCHQHANQRASDHQGHQQEHHRDHER